MIRSLSEIVYKNLKMLGRSKLSTLAIILVPFLIILFAGFAFNSSGLTGVKIGVYSDSYSNLTEDLLIDFESQDFTIIKFDSQEECNGSVQNSQTQICIIFPQDLSEAGSVEEVVFYVDHSRINVAHTLIHSIESRISLKASDLGISLAQSLIESLESAKDSLPEQISKLDISKENLGVIGEKTIHNISLEDIEDASGYLNSAKGLTNNSQIKTYIQDTIYILENLTTSNTLVVGNLEEINTQSENTILLLQEVSYKLDLLIANIGNSNVVGAEAIVSPIKTKIQSVNSNTNNRDYMLPTIISLIVLFGGILLSSTFILKERKSKAYFRNFITPTNDFVFLLGNYLTCLIILVVQFALVFIGIRYILNISLVGMLGQISLILFIALSAFIFIGMFIGYLFKSEETIIFSSVLVAVLMMFFSNAILPIETISSSFKNIALFNPLVVCDMALKKIILFNFNYGSIANELYILGAFFLGFAILSYIGRKITKRML